MQIKYKDKDIVIRKVFVGNIAHLFWDTTMCFVGYKEITSPYKETFGKVDPNIPPDTWEKYCHEKNYHVNAAPHHRAGYNIQIITAGINYLWK